MGALVTVQCPHCFEWVELWVDVDVHGRYIEDCEVCCRPWQLTVSWPAHGDTPNVRVERA